MSLYARLQPRELQSQCVQLLWAVLGLKRELAHARARLETVVLDKEKDGAVQPSPSAQTVPCSGACVEQIADLQADLRFPSQCLSVNIALQGKIRLGDSIRDFNARSSVNAPE